MSKINLNLCRREANKITLIFFNVQIITLISDIVCLLEIKISPYSAAYNKRLNKRLKDTDSFFSQNKKPRGGMLSALVQLAVQWCR